MTVNMSAAGQKTTVTGLKAGTATITYQFTVNSGSGYLGSINPIGPDTINVAEIAVNPSATDSYSVPQ
jgi:uncharacterized protein YjdB